MFPKQSEPIDRGTAGTGKLSLTWGPAGEVEPSGQYCGSRFRDWQCSCAADDE